MASTGLAGQSCRYHVMGSTGELGTEAWESNRLLMLIHRILNAICSKPFVVRLHQEPASVVKVNVNFDWNPFLFQV